MDERNFFRRWFPKRMRGHKHSEAQPSQKLEPIPTPFSYQPLQTSEPYRFRLVELAPALEGTNSKSIRCSLINSDWSEGKPYETLSYVWGDSRTKKTILLDDVPFSVTENLYSALEHLRQPDHSRILWIDAICINQSDVLERNHQVALMGQIYKNCQQVVIWLGEDDESTMESLEFMATLQISRNKMAKDVWKSWTLRFSPTVQEGFFNRSNLSQWVNVCSLLTRPWWSRAWIFQEFVNPHQAIFLIGKHTIPWQDVAFAIKILIGTPDIEGSLALYVTDPGGVLTDAKNLIYTRLQHNLKSVEPHKAPAQTSEAASPPKASWGHDSTYFAYLLSCQRHRNCGDPRDKVYSILGMTDEQVSAALAPDYFQSTRSIYIQAVQVHIVIYQNLDILCYSMYRPRQSLYPSWCPDWNRSQNKSIFGSSVQIKKFNASRERQPQYEFLGDNSVLRVKGIQISTVVHANIQSSSQEFSWKTTDSDATCNWDFSRIVGGILATEASLANNRQAMSFLATANKEENQRVCENVRDALVAGYYIIDNQLTRDPPAVFEDESTGVWWPADRAEFFRQVYQRTWGRILVMTDDGRLSLAPRGTRIGDKVFVIYGCCTPVVLSPRPDGAYTWIGDAYINSIMEGEGLTAEDGGVLNEEMVMIR